LTRRRSRKKLRDEVADGQLPKLAQRKAWLAAGAATSKGGRLGHSWKQVAASVWRSRPPPAKAAAAAVAAAEDVAHSGHNDGVGLVSLARIDGQHLREQRRALSLNSAAGLKSARINLICSDYAERGGSQFPATRAHLAVGGGLEPGAGQQALQQVALPVVDADEEDAGAGDAQAAQLGGCLPRRLDRPAGSGARDAWSWAGRSLVA
jgi:hypothetical protein